MFNLFKPKPKQTKDDIQRIRDEQIQKASRLKKISLDEFSGWKDFIELIDEYILALRKKKDATALDIASDETIQNLKLLDRERYVLEWVKQIPQQFVDNLEKKLKEEKDAE